MDTFLYQHPEIISSLNYPSSTIINSKILNFNNEVFVLSVDSQDISLPTEFNKTLEIICSNLSEKVLEVKTSEETIKQSLYLFEKELSLIIFKICIDLEYLKNLIKKSIESLQIMITDLNIKHINELLKESSEVHNFKTKAKKKFIFTISIEDSKCEFIEMFMHDYYINTRHFEQEFIKTFSFFKSQDSELLTDFGKFQKVLKNDKKAARKIIKNDLSTKVFNYLTYMVQYTRIAVFSTQISENGFIIYNDSFVSSIICSLVCQKVVARLVSCISISQKDVLITLRLNSELFLIHYNTTSGSNVLENFSLENFEILKGSTQDSIFIYKESLAKVERFCLFSGGLSKLSEYEMIIPGFSKITYLEYVQSFLGFIFIVNDHEVCLRCLKSSIVKVLFISEEVISKVRLSRDAKFWFIKNNKTLELKNDFFIKVLTLPLESNSFIILERNGNLFITGMNKNSFSQIVVKTNECSPGKSLNDRNPMKDVHYVMKNHLVLKETPNIDLSLLDKKFTVPDFCDDWELIKLKTRNSFYKIIIKKEE